MQAYLPMGMGFFGKRRSRHLIARRLQLLRRQGRTNDPLLDFTEQLENGNLDSHFETANLTCLFSVAGASADRPSPDPATLKTTNKQSTVFQSRLANQHGDWRHIYPSDAMRSWIDLFEPCSTPVRHRSPDDMRRHWLDQGCILSAYPGGMIRISAPIGGGA
jgi:hypothetical protein